MTAKWRSVLAAALTILAASLATSVGAADLVGAGSTFVTPIMKRWTEAYKETEGVAITYQSVGSSAGIKQIKDGAVDFGASDAPLTPTALARHRLMQFPIVLGAVVPVVNLPGIGPGRLKLTDEVLAQIYLGKITKWQDKAITDLNPELKLPINRDIAVIHRSDGSGTTFLWTKYLANGSREWNEKVGVDTALQWPTGLGGKGNEGVAALVSRIPGAIGYVEFAYTKLNNISYVRLPTADGQYVAPNRQSFEAAAESADWANAPGFYLLLTALPGKQSWPITGATFILMRKSPRNPEVAREVLKFFEWVYRHGPKSAGVLEYVFLPESVMTLVEQSWEQVKDADGKPVWTGRRS